MNHTRVSTDNLKVDRRAALIRDTAFNLFTEFQAWNAQGVASGLTSWVRSNVAREIVLQ